MRRYGSEFDGGYLMCDLDQHQSPILGVYSFGIEGRDRWGQEVALRTGAPLFEFDCMETDRPPCEVETCPETLFYEECLAAAPMADERSKWKRRNLRDFLELHHGPLSSIPDGSIVAKLDVEGTEWQVFPVESLEVLRKFAQIAAELHYPALTKVVPENYLARHRTKAMQLLLEVFVIVHVHVNNMCSWPEEGTCLEVTFAQPGIARPLPECRKPSTHPEDRTNAPRLPGMKVEKIFD